MLAIHTRCNEVWFRRHHDDHQIEIFESQAELARDGIHDS